MKIAVPALALLLGGAVLFARADKPERAAALPQPPRSAPEPLRPTIRVEETVQTPETPVPVVRTSVAPSPSPRKADGRPTAGRRTADWLQDVLALRDEQAQGVVAILDERDRTVADYEAEVHRRGWFRLDEFSGRIREIRELAYRRIAALLDAEQGGRFDALRAELFGKDYLSISLPDDKVVILE